MRKTQVTTKDLSVTDKLQMKYDIEYEPDFNIKLSADDKKDIIAICGHKKTVSFLVDQYYQSQNYRIKCQNQMRSLIQGYDEAEMSHPDFIDRELRNAMLQESLNKKYMDIITKTIPICQWMRSITGIGEVISAYLYSVFDIEKGHYAAEFISYAGQNDNNNPWLGEAKASAMVNEVLEWRDEKLLPLEHKLREWCGNEATFKKFKTQVKKYFKSTTDTSVYTRHLDQIALDLGINDRILPIYEEFEMELDEWCNLLVHSDYIGDLVVAKISELTTRKPMSIINGTKNIKKTGKQKTYLTSGNLKSYLAKPPYNIDLKKRCYLIGMSFVKQSKKEKSLYGKIYRDRKMIEVMKNERGEYKDKAQALLEEKNWSKDTVTKKALMEGKLSAGHIDARARRYAVKLFLNHVHEAMYYDYYHEPSPTPYVIEYMGHKDYIAPEVDYHPFLDK